MDETGETPGGAEGLPAREVRATVLVLAPPPADGLAVRGARAGIGAVGLLVQGLDRATGGSGRVPAPVDVALGAAASAADAAVVVAGVAASVAGRVTGPVTSWLARPAPLPSSWWPQRALDSWRVRGQELRRSQAADLEVALRRAGDPAVAWVLDRVDVGGLVARHVDLETVVVTALDDLDLTEVVLTRVDLRAVVDGALDRLDLTEVVLGRVDLQRVVVAVLDRLDLTDLVLTRVDLERVVTAVLDGMDLTQLVQSRVDIDALAATIDLDAIIDRLDLIGLADYIIDEIDLPAIIQQSTGSVASEAVRGVRMQTIDADRKASSVVDRLLLRRKGRRTDAPGDPESLQRGPEEGDS
ncbi:MAG: hypothetical protein R2737_04835 [Candidatus Nanopelagicales bacterium]